MAGDDGTDLSPPRYEIGDSHIDHCIHVED